MPKSERDRIQIDLTGTDIRERIEDLIKSDPVYAGRSLAAAFRILLSNALNGVGEVQASESEVAFLKRLEQRQWLSEAEIVDVAAELEVEPDLLIKLQNCIKEGSKKRVNGHRTS